MRENIIHESSLVLLCALYEGLDIHAMSLRNALKKGMHDGETACPLHIYTLHWGGQIVDASSSTDMNYFHPAIMPARLNLSKALNHDSFGSSSSVKPAFLTFSKLICRSKSR